MRGLLVRDKNFWIRKYSKHSELCSMHFGSPLKFKRGAINLGSLNPFLKDGYGDPCQIQCKILWVYVYTCVFCFFFLGRGLATFIRLGPCLKMFKNHCF